LARGATVTPSRESETTQTAQRNYRVLVTGAMLDRVPAEDRRLVPPKDINRSDRAEASTSLPSVPRHVYDGP